MKVLEESGKYGFMVEVDGKEEYRPTSEVIEARAEGVVLEEDENFCTILGQRYHRVMQGNKFLILPSDEQKEMIDMTIDACRFIHNEALNLSFEKYKETGESYYPTVKEISDKNTWTKAAPSTALNQELRKLGVAFKNFASGRAAAPKFRSFRNASGWSFTCQVGQYAVNVDKKEVTIPKIGSMEIRLCKPISSKPKMITVRKAPTERYWVSFYTYEWKKMLEGGTAVVVAPNTDTIIETSDGRTFTNLTPYARYEQKIGELSRELQGYEEGSHKYRKTKVRLAKLHEKIKNIRKNNAHLISNDIVKSSSSITVMAEPYKPKIEEGGEQAKEYTDAALFEVKRMLAYKADWYGREYQEVEKAEG